MLYNRNNPHGGDIYKNKIKWDFSANVSPFGTPYKIKQAIKKNVNSLWQYPDPYCTKLRTKIATHHHTSADYIFCGNGAADIIFSFVMGANIKSALIVIPTFCEYENALKTNNSIIKKYLLSEKNNFNLDDKILDCIDNALNCVDNKLECIFICNPNNPTGVLYNREILTKILDKCEKNNIILFIDECFMDIATNGENATMIQKIETSKNLIILKAFTKSYGLAGVRLGYCMCSNKELLTQMSKTTQAWNVSTLAQNAGYAALDCNKFIEKLKKHTETEREYLKKELENRSFTVYNSSTNYLLIETTFPLYDELYKRSIMIRKCDNFQGLNNKYYRIAIKSHKYSKILLKSIDDIFAK